MLTTNRGTVPDRLTGKECLGSISIDWNASRRVIRRGITCVSLCVHHLNHDSGIAIGVNDRKGELNGPVWRGRRQFAAHIQRGNACFRTYRAVYALADRIRRQKQDQHSKGAKSYHQECAVPEQQAHTQGTGLSRVVLKSHYLTTL